MERYNPHVIALPCFFTPDFTERRAVTDERNLPFIQGEKWN